MYKKGPKNRRSFFEFFFKSIRNAHNDFLLVVFIIYDYQYMIISENLKIINITQYFFYNIQ